MSAPRQGQARRSCSAQTVPHRAGWPANPGTSWPAQEASVSFPKSLPRLALVHELIHPHQLWAQHFVAPLASCTFVQGSAQTLFQGCSSAALRCSLSFAPGWCAPRCYPVCWDRWVQAGAVAAGPCRLAPPAPQWCRHPPTHSCAAHPGALRRVRRQGRAIAWKSALRRATCLDVCTRIGHATATVGTQSMQQMRPQLQRRFCFKQTHPCDSRTT